MERERGEGRTTMDVDVSQRRCARGVAEWWRRRAYLSRSACGRSTEEVSKDGGEIRFLYEILLQNGGAKRKEAAVGRSIPKKNFLVGTSKQEAQPAPASPPLL